MVAVTKEGKHGGGAMVDPLEEAWQGGCDNWEVHIVLLSLVDNRVRLATPG